MRSLHASAKLEWISDAKKQRKLSSLYTFFSLQFRTFHFFTLCTRLWIRNNSLNYTRASPFQCRFAFARSLEMKTKELIVAFAKMTQRVKLRVLITRSVPVFFSERNPVCASNLALRRRIIFFTFYIVDRRRTCFVHGSVCPEEFTLFF